MSVSVGGFTGQATVKSRKTSLATVQTAVDIFGTDQAAGDGTQAAPTGLATTFPAAAVMTDWYTTDGKTWASTLAAALTFTDVSVVRLTSVTTTTIGNSSTTRGPYLRSSSNVIRCIFASSGSNALAGDNTISTQFKVIACLDTT